MTKVLSNIFEEKIMKITRGIVKNANAGEVLEIDPFVKPNSVMSIAITYQKAFGGKPWNEGYLCPVCKTSYPRDNGNWSVCPECLALNELNVRLVEYWSTDKIITDFYQEMSKPGSVCMIMQRGHNVIAFTWGYEVKIDKSLDKYLESPGLHKLIKGNFLYLDECAVLPSCQNKGCGKKMVKAFLQKAKKTKKDILLRTMKNSVMHKMVIKLGGEVVQDISRERVIMMIGIK